jgi:hypothetical protein
MTKSEAHAYVRSCGESDGPESYDDAAEIFAALYDRAPDENDGDAGDVWSLCCAAVEAEGTMTNIRVERSCAERMVEHDSEWVEVLK